MIITNDNSGQLLANYSLTLSNLFTNTQKAIEFGAEKLGLQRGKIVDGVFYVKKLRTVGYLAISPSDKRLYNVDDDLNPVDVEYFINEVEYEHLYLFMEQIVSSATTK